MSHIHMPSSAALAASSMRSWVSRNSVSLACNCRASCAACSRSLLNSYPIAATIPEYAKQRKNGTSMIPQITSGTCHARIAPKIMLPPRTKARRRSPRRQTVIVASTKKIRSNSRLTELRRPHGFATPNGTEIISPPHREVAEACNSPEVKIRRENEIEN